MSNFLNIEEKTTFQNNSVDFDHIPESEHVDYIGLPSQALIKRCIWTAVFWILVIATVIISRFYLLEKQIWLVNYFELILIGLSLAGITRFLITYFEFPYIGYHVRERDVLFKKGLIVRRKIHVPFNRVQHCEVIQSFLDRMFRLGKIKIFTAGGSSSDLVISDLPHEDALKLKDFILSSSNE